MRLVIISWFMFSVTIKAQDTVVTPSHAQFIDTSLYQFLQRQNQINNAIMLNNALLANSLVTVPSREHHIRIPNTLQFPVTNLPPLFHDFSQTMPTVPIAGLNRLGIYDVLSSARGVDDIKHPLIPAQVTDPLSSTSSLPIEDKTMSVIRSTELKKKIEGDAFVPSHKETKQDQSEKRENVYNLLRTFNLTDEESEDIVSHVEKIIREELVKKLSEVRLLGHRNHSDVSQESSTVVSSTLATTQGITTEEESKPDEHTTISLERSTPEKELLFLLPKKNGQSEIKHHPQRISVKSSENRSNYVEAEIFTAQLHLPIEEKMVDEKNYDDLPLSNEEQMTLELNEHLKDKEHDSSSISTSSTVKPTTNTVLQQSSTSALRIAKIREVVSNTTNNTKEVTKKAHNGIDADVLTMKFVTGAPLDLDNEDNRAVSYRNRYLPRSTYSTAPTFLKPPSGKPRPTTHPKTPFERLVVDYKQRLAAGMDIDKILKSLYSNAYIALIDAKDAPKVQIPLSMRRPGITLG